ncbi:pilus assembly protein TadG-related protein [Phytohabitans houttuyneae]|uniref:Flp pilus-assembly TadG-like N-terminal domain-containing protein n=1 Tax=Phytohabitans houttuyneae TaxID=1076126 RepID=A0A6V8KKU8_9ACTN|nr:pilus assembly protein TadG-related protein [Phytohabitans houttuyneae]GFJ85812.1 hypothetical protein Phou_099920 [Phytohabitans houttuyneae]
MNRLAPPTRTRVVELSRDSGQISGGIAGTVLLVLLLAGLLTDPAAAIAARVRLFDIAQAAARAGADHIDIELLRSTGTVVLDPQAARRAATTFLADTGTNGAVTATETQVTVTIAANQPTILLTLVGIDALPITVTATAEPQTGN